MGIFLSDPKFLNGHVCVYSNFVLHKYVCVYVCIYSQNGLQLEE